MEEVTENKLSKAIKFGYAFGTFGESIAYNFYYLFFIYFLTDFAGISPGIAGTISLTAVLWDAITDPVVGYLSDNSKNPKGKRRPFIISFCIPLGITVFLTFTNFIGLVGTAKVAYYLIINILFWTFFTATDIPYITLGGEITLDPNERLSIRGIATSFNYAGTALASAGTILMVTKFGEILGDVNKGWSVVGVIMGAVVVISFIVAYVITKDKESVNEAQEDNIKVNLFKSLFELFKIRPYRYLLLYNLFLMTGVMLYTSATIYLYRYFLKATEAQMGKFYLAGAIMTMAFSPIIGKIATKIGSKKSLVFSVFIVTIGFGIFRFIPFTFITNYILIVSCAIAMSGFFVLGYAMVYDIGEISELKTGFRNDGVVIAFFSFFLKLATAIGMWLVGVLLNFYKYNPDNITTETLNGIRNMCTIIPTGFCLIGVIFAMKYSLTPKNLTKLKYIIKSKEAGEDIDMVEVNRIL